MTARRSQFRDRYANEDLNVWPAYTDLISNAFMILSLFMFFSIFSAKQNETPPILLIPDAGSFSFSSGSAELSDTLKTYIKTDLLKKIKEKNQEYNINVVEIIGHTDGAIKGGNSNLDEKLENVANLKDDVQNLIAGSNADLGLIRALAVVNELRQIPELECLEPKDTSKFLCLQFRAYSAAQLVLPSGEIADVNRDEDDLRRRIEVRFTKSGEEEKAKE